VGWVNTLVGTAPLDKQEFIGNAPPPGEELYTGMTSAAAVLPHGITDLGPINKNLDLSYPAGVGMYYNYPHRTMFGFTNGMPGMVVMPATSRLLTTTPFGDARCAPSAEGSRALPKVALRRRALSLSSPRTLVGLGPLGKFNHAR